VEILTLSKPFYVGLLHHPVYNQKREIITTAVTNADIHDLARTCRTYNIRKLFIITPISKQRELVRRIVEHWTLGSGGLTNQLRKEAMHLVEIVSSLEEAREFITRDSGTHPFLIGTSAVDAEHAHDTQEILRQCGLHTGSPFLILGTGWGIQREVLDSFDSRLKPINGIDGYNHLSVRCAAAILLDRLLGTR
jgi:hypothetical protein